MYGRLSDFHCERYAADRSKPFALGSIGTAPSKSQDFSVRKLDPAQSITLHVARIRPPASNVPCICLHEFKPIVSCQAGALREIQNVSVAIEVNDRFDPRPTEIIGSIVLPQINEAHHLADRSLRQELIRSTQFTAFARSKNLHR